MAASINMVLTGTPQWWANNDQFFVLEWPDGSYTKLQNTAGIGNTINVTGLDQVGLYKTHHVVNDPGDVTAPGFVLPDVYPLPDGTATALSPRVRTFAVSQTQVNSNSNVGIGQTSFRDFTTPIDCSVMGENEYFTNSNAPRTTLDTTGTVGTNGLTGVPNTANTAFASITYEPVNQVVLGVRKTGASGAFSAVDAGGSISYAFDVTDNNGAYTGGMTNALTNDGSGFVYAKKDGGTRLVVYDMRDPTSPNWLKPVRNDDTSKLASNGTGVALQIFDSDLGADMDWYDGFIYHNGLNRIYKIDPATGLTETMTVTTGNSVLIPESMVVIDGIAYFSLWNQPIDNNVSYYSLPITDFVDGDVRNATLISNTLTVFHSGDTCSMARIVNSEQTKTVDQAVAQIGDELTYTVTFKNTSPFPMTSVTVQDLLPTETSFVANSLSINGVSSNADITTNTQLPDLAVGETVTLVFKALVDAVPTTNPIVNTADFTYIIENGSSEAGTASVTGGETVIGSTPDFTGDGFVKSVDKVSAMVGDTVSYTLVVTNNGTATSLGTKLFDIIPQETSLVGATLLVDGVAATGDLVAGVELGDMAQNDTKTVTFDVLIDSQPTDLLLDNTGVLDYTYDINGQILTGNQASNTVFTVVPTSTDSADLSGSSKIAPATTIVGSTVTYTVVARNTGAIEATNVVLTDVIPTGTTFVSGSVTVNGASTAEDPATGIAVGTLAANGGASTVTFDVVVDTIPDPNPMENTGNFTYDDATGTGLTANTNTVATQVNQTPANLGNATKTVDNQFPSVGDTVTYTMTIANDGQLY